jgi:hypothetical protein
VTFHFLRSAVCATLLATAGTAAAQQQDVKFEFHGFVGGSIYTENAALSSGGGAAAWVVTGEPTQDKGLFGGDVRQTRLNFSLTGPQVFEDATPRAFAEIDFFGGNTAGGFGDISIAPRLRIAFAELKLAKTGTMVRAGQDHDLVLGIVLPATVGHVAFPLSYQAGTIGWRRPGLGVYQTLPVAGMKVELAASVGRSGWSGATPAESALGMASGLPSFQGRVKLQAKIFEAFVAGHFNRIDVDGQGADGDAELDTTAITAGGRVSYLGATLAGAGYMGKNLGPLAGNLLQWQPTAALTGAAAELNGGPVDISEIGAWAQLGYNITPTVSVWALHGFANPDDEDLVKATLTRSRNSISSGMLRYQSKGYSAGLEYTMFRTSYTNQAKALEGNQLMLSGMYFF